MATHLVETVSNTTANGAKRTVSSVAAPRITVVHPDPLPQNIQRWKRLVDVAVSATLLLFVFPLMVLFAILVKLDSRGPIFYRQLRVGVNERRRARRRAMRRTRAAGSDGRRLFPDRRQGDGYGRPFPVLKFRTMRVDAERNGAQWCQQNDPRVTRVGNFLRKTHLDELPQLINILRGDMSLVGPRPERPEFVRVLSGQIPDYPQRLALKPGLTGLAQIRHRADLVIDDVKKKIRYDFLYMKRASVTTDLKIILGTVPMVLGISLYSYKRLKKARRFFNAVRPRSMERLPFSKKGVESREQA